MLVLSRKVNESLMLIQGDLTIEVTIIRIGEGQCRIGVQAPESVNIVRKELLTPIERAAAKR